MSLECLRIYGNARLDVAPNMPSCAWSLWPLFFSARYFFSISLSGSQKDKIVYLGLFMLWLPQPCQPVCLKGLKAWIFTDPFSRAQMRKHPEASGKRTPEVDGSFSWSHRTGRAGCLVSKPPSSVNPLQPVVSAVIPHASLLGFDGLSCQKHRDLLPKQTLLTREQPAQQNWQGHALQKAKGEQRWVGGDHCNRGALFCTAGHPERGKRTQRVLERKMLSVSHSGHQTQMNISFFPSPSSHPPDEGISDSTGYTGYS